MREYADHPEVVEGFVLPVLPVLVGEVEPGRVRNTFEQPAAAWVEHLCAADFTDVAAEPLRDHRWAPAVLVTAAGSA